MTDIIVGAGPMSKRMLSEGIVERWFVPNGTIVKAGDRVEDARHELIAPEGARLLSSCRPPIASSSRTP